MPNSKGYENTPNLKDTIVNKGNMKALQRFIQIEIKEHNHGEFFYFIMHVR